ncbi:MAG TPA: TerB family tellurite resistance protein [Ignavibacteria bacterium]|nr:TerB family tellurite resistance protein [Ignavibacteria bacterium]
MNFQEILNLFRQGKATAKSHIKNLIEIAAADGKFTADEENLLESIAKKNNITPKQIEDIRKNNSQITFEVPKNPREKFHQLYDLVHMMSVDKDIHTEELRLCELFAVKFGYPNEAVKEMVESIRQNIEHNNDPDETMKRVASYIKF